MMIPPIDRKDHPEERERVKRKIAARVLEFYQLKLQSIPFFHLKDLLEFCEVAFPNMAPHSPARTLQLLRLSKELDYRCISRINSLYVMLPLEADRSLYFPFHIIDDMTIRARKAYKSLLKRHTKYGHETSFTELELFTKITTAVIDGGCPYCFGDLTWDNFSPDHVVPLQKGGSPLLSNIEIVCAQCNWAKGANAEPHHTPDPRISP